MVVLMEEPQSTPKKKETLDVFWKLANSKSDKDRVEAASKVLQSVSKSSLDADYVLSRLMKGLSSTSPGAREGYFICLTELLRQTSLTYDQVASVVGDQLKSTSTLAKGEEGEMLVAHLLTLTAVLRSGVQGEDKGRLLTDLLEISQARSYFLLPAVNLLTTYYLSEGSDTINKICQTVKTQLTDLNVDSLLLLLSIYKQNPTGIEDDKLLADGGKKLLKKKSLETFAKVLMSSTLPPAVFAKHPVIPLLVELLIEKELLNKFWPFIQSEMTAANNKGLVGWILLTEICKQKVSLVPDLLTRHVLSVGQQLASRQASVKMVKQVMASLVAEADTGSLDRKNLIKKFLDLDLCWDKLSCGPVVGQLLGKADGDTVREVGEMFLSTLVGDGKVMERVYSGNQLVKLVGHPAVQTDILWRGKVLKSLAGVSVLVGVEGIESLTSSGKDQLKDVMFRALDTRNKSLEDSVTILQELVNHVQSQVLKGDGRPAKTVSEGHESLVKEAEVNIKKLEEGWEKDKNKQVGVFLFLYYQIWLQTFSQPDLAVEVLTELSPVYERWGQKEQAKEEEPVWVEVVTEILLSLLAQNNHLLRGVVGAVFSVICNQMTDISVENLLAVIGSSNEDGKDDEEGSDDEEDMDEGENDEEDVEDDEPLVEEKDESDDSDGSESESDNEDEKKVDTSFVKKVTDALGDHADKSESESEIDMDEIPDEDMNKLDQKLVDAFKLLGGKDRLAKKKEKMSALANIHFKLRVLDLLDIYLAHQPQAGHLLKMIPVLVQALDNAIRNPAQAQPLISKLIQVLGKLVNIKITANVLEVGEQVVEVLENVLQMATAGSVVVTNLGPTYPRLANFLLRLGETCQQESKLETIYLEALNDFLTKSVCVLPNNIFSLAMSHPWSGCWSLASQLATAAFSPSVRMFRRVAAANILSDLVKRKAMVIENKDHMISLMANLVPNIMSELEKISQSVGKTKPKYLTDLLHILSSVKDKQIDKDVEWEKVGLILVDIASNWPGARQFKLSRQIMNSLASKCDVKLNYGTVKHDNGEAKEQSEEQTKKKKNKKKKNQDNLKKSKEMKIKLAEALDAEGIPSFSEFVDDNVNDSEMIKPDSVKRKADDGEKNYQT